MTSSRFETIRSDPFTLLWGSVECDNLWVISNRWSGSLPCVHVPRPVSWIRAINHVKRLGGRRVCTVVVDPNVALLVDSEVSSPLIIDPHSSFSSAPKSLGGAGIHKVVFAVCCRRSGTRDNVIRAAVVDKQAADDEPGQNNHHTAGNQNISPCL